MQMAAAAAAVAKVSATAAPAGPTACRFLQCALCREELSDPRYLPCSHTFCSACLDAYVEENSDQERVLCPQCRQWYKDIDSDALPRNDFIAALVRARKSPALCRLCGVCKSRNLIVQACSDCRADVCVDCASAHYASAQTRSHRAAPASDLVAFMTEQRPALCGAHGRPLEYHCRQCDRPKCQECARACERHDVRSFADAAGDARRRLDGLVCRMQESQQRRASTSSATSPPSPSAPRSSSSPAAGASSPTTAESQRRFLVTIDRVQAEIEERHQKFVDALSLIRDHALSEIELVRQECATVVASSATAASCGGGAISYCQRLLEVGRAADVVCQSGALADHLKRLMALNATPLVCPDVQLVFDPRKDVLETLRTLFGGPYVKAADGMPLAAPAADDERQLRRFDEGGAVGGGGRRPTAPSLVSVLSLDAPGRTPPLVCEIEVPHHVNGIVATSERASVMLATKGIRVYNMAPRTLPPAPPEAGAVSSPTTSVAATPGIVVSDEDGSQVRSLTTLRTVAGREVFDTGGDEVRSFCVKTRFLHAALLSNGFIVTTNDTKKSLTVYTPNGIVAAECHVPKSKGPWGVAVAGGDKIVLADCDARRVTVHDGGGQLLVTIDKDATGRDYFGYPCFVAARDATIVVSDVNRHRVLAFDVAGRHLWRYGGRGSGPVGELYRPEGVCMDELGNVYVAENGNGRITVLSNDGAFKRTLLSGEHGLCEPFSVAINKYNELFVLERAISSPRKPMKIKLFSLLVSE